MCSNGCGNTLRTLHFHSLVAVALRGKAFTTGFSSETQGGFPEFPTAETFEEIFGKVLVFTLAVTGKDT